MHAHTAAMQQFSHAGDAVCSQHATPVAYAEQVLVPAAAAGKACNVRHSQ
jgi:hypothetical protein